MLLVDDQALVRAGLRLILDEDVDCQIVGECSDGSEVMALAERTQPQVVVMDVRMKQVGGIEALKQLRASGHPAHVLMLTTFDEDAALLGALQHGARGFIFKDAAPEDLLRAIQTVASGGMWLDPAVSQRVLSTFQGLHQKAPLPEDLTEREIEVLKHIGSGKNNLEIADVLAISEATVKTHVTRIFQKLGVRDRAEAVVYAFNSGLVRPSGKTS
ncbi:putative two-component system response regulator LuxR [Deinococcus cellulosilyticus NBRC 106333 = KACC 11606]|uniref:Putative two-component system response regulator LuxR n=1 Tax=Deinococcus cellulosilyticus (strain DSM 18568 / NBRC 106333 / KACC 11606 / 5516J-15) TaxID=1223518 RepID=A0A511N389_DEIC1|nr:putative two-component system response regulator LuxR [Deinococcus cellulosilyticus NBRC 106333 = KACC 11606]